MKNVCIATLIGLLAGPVFAQNPKIDSLNHLLAKANTDTARVNRSLDIAEELFAISYDSCLTFAVRTQAFARRIAYPIGEAKALMMAGRAYTFKGNFAQARQALDRAGAILSSQNETVRFGRLYINYGVLYLKQNQTDSAAFFFRKAIPIAQRSKDRELLQGLYINLSTVYKSQTNYPQALAYLQKALQMAQQRQDLKNQAGIYLNIGTVLLETGDTVRAERNTFSAMRFAKQAGNRYIEMLASNNLARVYEVMKQYTRAYQYCLRSASIAKQIGATGPYVTYLMSAAWMLSEQKQYGRAEALNRRAMTIADSLQESYIIYDVYTTMGSIFTEQGKYALALPYYERAFSSLGGIKLYNPKTAIVYANMALCYEKTGQYQKALSAFRRSATLNDSLRNRESIRKVTEQNLTFEFAKTQAAASAKAQAAESESRLRQWALGGGLVVALLLMAMAFVGYRSKQRANLRLQSQKEQIEQTLTQLRNTQTQLIQKEKMASLGELTAGIAHEIQNPLNFVNNFSEVSAEMVAELADEHQKPQRDADLETELLTDLKGNLHKITLHGQRASNIVKGMLEHARNSSGDVQPTNLNALADEYLRLAYHGQRAKEKNFTCELTTHFDPAIGQVTIMPQEIGRVLLNLFSNAFYAVRERQKRGQADYQPAVTVSTVKTKAGVEIRVTDNGVGMPQSVQQKIFQPFFTTKPTGEGTGLGLSLSYDIITKGHGGSLRVASEDGQGTEFTVELPTARVGYSA
ncbi:tetratricopeptide repeat protein [Spirosoma arcticum]